jgi:AA9 family protein
MKELKQDALKGQIQIYPHCFNLDIVGSGTVTPEGVSFPGAYKPNDAGLTFSPYMTYGTPDPAAAMEHNSKYVSSVLLMFHITQLTALL